MTGMIGAMTLIGGCAVCAANDTEYGWFVLAGTALLSAMALASAFAWRDSQRRVVLPLHVDD